MLIDNSKTLFKFYVGWKFAVLDKILIENLVHFGKSYKYKNALRITKIYHQFVSKELNFWPKQNLKSVLGLSIGSEQILILWFW